MWLQERTWPEIESYLAEHTTVLVPVGSTEQHGPHLPVGTDTMEAISVAEGVADRLDILITPPLWFGDARHHLGFPGTVAFRPETLQHALKDIYDSLAFHGFQDVITINGHRRANVPAIQTAMKIAKEENPDTSFAVADLIQIAASKHKELRESDDEYGTHAGEFETSFMMQEYPDLVHEDEFRQPEIDEPVSSRVTNNSVDHSDKIETASSYHDQIQKRTANGFEGHSGDPTKATTDKGEKLREAMIEAVVTFVTDVR